MNDMTLIEFLTFLATCSGDEAIDKVSEFQAVGLSVEGIFAEELEA